MSDRAAAGDRFLWWVLTVLMLLLGVNKQLDLQTPFIALGRLLSVTEGWYSERRIVQWTFVGCLGLVGFAFLCLVVWRLRHSWVRHVFSLFGIVILMFSVLLEAAPDHPANMPQVESQMADKRQILELLGISCVGLSAAMHLLLEKYERPS